MGHQIEDCSTCTALLLLITWYAYAIFGNIVIIEDNKEKHCYVMNNQNLPTATIDSSIDKNDFQDVAKQGRYISFVGMTVLIIQFILICLAGYHKVIAWLAGCTFLAWLWYFIDLHRIRYSHSGQVCFGDFLPAGSEPGSPYLLHEGSFF